MKLLLTIMTVTFVLQGMARSLEKAFVMAALNDVVTTACFS
jgi:hypothetical protein